MTNIYVSFVHSIFEFSIARLKVEGLPSDGVEDGPIGFVGVCMYVHLQFQYEIFNCSYECNISYRDNVPTILHQFLKPGSWSEACFAGPTSCPSIALPLSVTHPPWGEKINSISDHVLDDKPNTHGIHLDLIMNLFKLLSVCGTRLHCR